MHAPADHRAAIDFVSRLARALHTFGSPAHRLEQAMQEVAASVGLEASFFATPTAVFASYGSPEGPITRLERVPPGDHDLEKLCRLDAIAARVARGELDVPTATRAVDEVVEAPPRYGRALTLAAFAVASAGAATFFGGSHLDLGASAVAGALIGALALLAARGPAFGGIFEAVAAVIVSALAAAAASFLGASAFVVTVSGLIVMVPGLTLTLAISELASRHLASGTARLTGALTVFLLIGFGVALGSRLSLVLPPDALTHAPALPPWTQAAAVVAVGSALVVLFRAHPSDTLWILGAGAVGFYGARAGAILLGPELGTFAGGMLVGLAGNLYARLLERPSAVAAVPGIMLLVPGSLGFRSLVALMDDNVVSGIETAFTTTLVAAALVAGLLAANLLLPSRRAL